MPSAGLSQHCRLRVFLTGSCALLLLLFLAQSTDASCGDWLADSSSMEFHSNTLTPAGVSRMEQISDVTSWGGDVPAQNGRCHGPLCRNAPIPANPPVPVQVSPSIQQWLQLTSLVKPHGDDGISPIMPRDEISTESEASNRLDRPPCC